MSHDTYPSIANHSAENTMRFSSNPALHKARPLAASSIPAPDPLQRLCNALDTAFEQSADAVDPSQRAAFASAVRAALADAAADPALLSPAQREGSRDTYRRHLLAADPQGRYAIAALVWQPGQASPIHAHQTWCGYAVVNGSLSETVYDWSNTQRCASETRTHPRASGAVSFVRAGRGGIHRLGNTSDAVAVSLHIYGVEGSQIATHVNDLLEVTQPVERDLA
ncbi:MAG: cysteine dioxygenase family protein [Paraburkholderia sp.]|uniref:cysteine dioxygenase family protein n=1 Tax=Paraburkholderia sp. TaxID=1926495 RepID=UPI003C3AB180